MSTSIPHEDGLLSYRVSGKGQPVVCIHGFAEDGSVWQQLAAELENDYRLILPDLPGSGQSPLSADVSMEAMADAVKRILDEEGISEAVMIGHSMGGYVTLAFAEKFPAMLKALGLFHSTAYADNEEKKASRRKNMAFIQAHGTYEYLKQGVPVLFSNDTKQAVPGIITDTIERYRYIEPAALVAYNEAMIRRPDRTDILKNAVKPVLFIIGKQDNAVPFQQSLQLTHLPVISYIHILEHSGHMGMFEETEKSNQILEEFLQQIYS
jgi:pimeloyl-ACP methyl ester carboxylesterase